MNIILQFNGVHSITVSIDWTTFRLNSEPHRSTRRNEAEHLVTLPEDEAVVAMMGLPRPGEITRAQLRIKESKEFKVQCVDVTYVTRL